MAWELLLDYVVKNSPQCSEFCVYEFVVIAKNYGEYDGYTHKTDE